MSVQIATGRREFYQWDVNQRLLLNDIIVGTEVHLSLKSDDVGDAIVTYAYSENGFVYVNVPNDLLQSSGMLNVYVYLMDNREGHTEEHWTFKIRSRNKPANYVTTDDNTSNDSGVFNSLVLQDTATGLRYVLSVTNGKLTMSEVTEE